MNATTPLKAMNNVAKIFWAIWAIQACNLPAHSQNYPPNFGQPNWMIGGPSIAPMPLQPMILSPVQAPQLPYYHQVPQFQPIPVYNTYPTIQSSPLGNAFDSFAR